MRRALLLYFTSEVLLSLGLGLALYCVPFVYKLAGLPDPVIGALFAVNSVVAGVSAPLVGSMADRIGATRVWKFATFLVSTGLLATGIVHRAAWWGLTAALNGLGGALLMTTENVVLSTLTKGQEKAGVLSRFVALYTFAMGVGNVLAGPLSVHYSYRTGLIVGAVLAFMGTVTRLFVQAPDTRAQRMFRLPSRRLVAMSIYAGIFGLAVGLFNPFATLILNGQFGLGANLTAAVAAASTFTMSLGAFTVSPLVRRLRHSRVLFLCFALAIAITLAMAPMHGALGFAALYLLRTGATSMPGSIVDAMFLEVTDPKEYSQMFGVRVFGTSAGNAAGAYGGGLLLSHYPVGLLLILSAAVIFCAYVYLLALVRRLPRVDRDLATDRKLFV